MAFRHPRRGYHTGIYVGEGKFIHSPRRRSSVKISSLDDPYFSKTFLGARRVNVDGGANLVAQAESRLADYAEEKAVRELSIQKKPAGKSRRSVKSRRAARGKVVQVASNEAPPARQDRCERQGVFFQSGSGKGLKFFQGQKGRSFRLRQKQAA